MEQQQYIKLLENVNQQLSFRWNTINITLFVLAIIVGVLTIVAMVIIFMMGWNYRKAIKDFFAQNETVGVWESNTNSIIILRRMLNSTRDYAGTLIHETIHAKSGLDDINRNFEHELTIAIGQVCDNALKKRTI